jgi:hypothetical protein
MSKTKEKKKMKKELALKLKDYAYKIAKNFSRSDREFNYTNETFEVVAIKPLSETTAYIEFKKSSGKIGVAFCYWINMGGGQWRYFFPTYDHAVGAERLRSILYNIESRNFPFNFKE